MKVPARFFVLQKRLFEHKYDFGRQFADDSVKARQESVSCQRNILDDLHTIIMDAVCGGTTEKKLVRKCCSTNGVHGSNSCHLFGEHLYADGTNNITYQKGGKKICEKMPI